MLGETDAGGGTYTSPSGDAGTLVSAGGGTWNYTSYDGKVQTFDSSGRMTTWTSADGAETLTYTFLCKYSCPNETPGSAGVDRGRNVAWLSQNRVAGAQQTPRVSGIDRAARAGSIHPRAVTTRCH